MRRMYSEQELTNVIKAVFEQEVEDGALDENIADAVDDYLTEHPVDVTAITGLDIAPKDVTASGNITAPSIIENMSGYSFTKGQTTNITYEYIYAGAVKNGNKVTFVNYLKFKRTDEVQYGIVNMGIFGIPLAVGNKLIPTTGNVLTFNKVSCNVNFNTSSQLDAVVEKQSSTSIQMKLYGVNDLTANTDYYVRYEITFLLSDSLVPEE